MYIKPTKEQIKEFYVDRNLGSGPTGKILNVSRNNVIKLVREYGFEVKKRAAPIKYHANHNFFSSWNESMAYCLGFIAADGHVWKKRPFITIGIHKKDKYVLEYIRDCISPMSKVRHTRNNVQINVWSEQIVKDLAKYNIKNNKTFNMKIDFDIPEKYWGDYLRGYFDGDGSIFRKKYKNNDKIFYISSIVGASEKFLIYIQKRLGFGRIRTIRKKYFELGFSQRNTYLLGKIMYKNDNSFRMIRKYIKFQDLRISDRKGSILRESI